MKGLVEIQAALKVKKDRLNSIGGYKYRSCEDILEAAKPLLLKNGLSLTITDTIVNVGTRFYVCATAAVSDDKTSVSVQGFAREGESKKGMDEAQITGAASSYARKYALCGLFLIDDGNDADSQNKHEDLGKSKSVELPAEVAHNISIACDIEPLKKYCEEQRVKHPEWTQALVVAFKTRAAEIAANKEGKKNAA